MSYAIYYPGCATPVPDYQCNGCDDELEHGRVRSVAYINKSFLSTLIASPIAATWKTGIVNKNIIIIPEVIGSFDGGAPNEGPGYGDNDTNLLGYKFTLAYKDPNYLLNAAFYNAIKKSRDFVVAYRTETQIHISDKSVKVIPKNPVAEDLNSDVVYDVTVTFSQQDLPVPIDTPVGIFDCFAYEA